MFCYLLLRGVSRWCVQIWIIFVLNWKYFTDSKEQRLSKAGTLVWTTLLWQTKSNREMLQQKSEHAGKKNPHKISESRKLPKDHVPCWNTCSYWTTSTSACWWRCCLLGCLTSQQHASVSQGWICSDNFTCCHTEIEAADQTFYLTQLQYTDTGRTSPSADPITPGAWQGSFWNANF